MAPRTFPERRSATPRLELRPTSASPDRAHPRMIRTRNRDAAADSVRPVDDLFDPAPQQQPTPGAGAPSYYNIGIINHQTASALPSSPSTTLNQSLAGLPDLRTLIVSFGANDVLKTCVPDPSVSTLTSNRSRIW